MISNILSTSIFCPPADDGGGGGGGAIAALHFYGTTANAIPFLPFVIFIITSSSSDFFLGAEQNFTFVPACHWGRIFNNFSIWLNWFVSIQLRHYLLFFNLNIMRLLFMVCTAYPHAPKEERAGNWNLKIQRNININSRLTEPFTAEFRLFSFVAVGVIFALSFFCYYWQWLFVIFYRAPFHSTEIPKFFRQYCQLKIFAPKYSTFRDTNKNNKRNISRCCIMNAAVCVQVNQWMRAPP